MTTPESKTDALYEQLLSASRQAFTEEGYETAYHALTAAMHRARDLQSFSLLHDLVQEANTQKNELDRIHPTHILSSSSAQKRGNVSLYYSLVQQIETVLRLFKVQDDVAHLREREKDLRQQ